MPNFSIGFCGAPGSGKSTLSHSVASALGWPRVGFGDYVRAEAQRRKMPMTRPDLQELGASLLAQDAHAFCEAVLAPIGPASGRSIIIDGIRHLEVVRLMGSLLAPAQLRLIYVAIDETTREERMAGRQGFAEPLLEQIDMHSTELEVSRYLAHAGNLVVDGATEVPVLTNQIVAWVRQHMA